MSISSGLQSMTLIGQTLSLCLVLALTNAAPRHLDDEMIADDALSGISLPGAPPDRCDGIEFDAIAPDEKGKVFFFKDQYVWKGVHGPANLTSEYFRELDDQHPLGSVDAALRMHTPENTKDHDHIYLFQGTKVYSYFNHTLEEGYPKDIQQDFPEVPSHLDAAVECPKGECVTDSVLFFKGSDVYSYDIATKSVKTRTWPQLPVCTSAFRWLEHYYCFHGNNFTRFHPVSGEVETGYPKDARAYFMRCPKFGHGGASTVPKCSDVSIDAITSDDAGKTYTFKGPIYMRLDTSRDGRHHFPIGRSWKEVSRGVDAAFSHSDKIYFIKGNQVYIYKSAAHYVIIKGYPKTLKEELGVEGDVDAAFACAGDPHVHIIQEQKMLAIDLTATPRVVTQEYLLPFDDIDAALCGPNGVDVFKGSQYYHYRSPTILGLSKIAVVPHNITSTMMGCRD